MEHSVTEVNDTARKIGKDQRVNNQWRIIFIWDDERGEADGIYLDNHAYK